MPDPGPSLRLAADFPVATEQQWRTAVAAVLARGRTGEPPSGDEAVAALSHTTYDAITVAPLYTAADVAGLPGPGRPGVAPFVRGATATRVGWDVRACIDDPDPAAAARTAVEELETGATSLWLVVGEGAIAPGDLGAALDGVYLDLAPIVLDAGAHTLAAVDALLDLAAARSVAPGELRGSAGADPIGGRARTGAPADLTLLARLAERLSDAPGVAVATVDATVYHDAGASDAQELGIATAVGLAYLRVLTEAGSSVDDALRRLEFRLAVTDDQFASLAKLRAGRRVWSRVAELSGATGDAGAQRQHALTSTAMLTARDPWVNLLRTTIAGFAAAVGGADAVTVTPFDAAIGRSDRFARRLARNTQSILHDESSLARVLDPAGGSWYVESLTDALAEAAWTVFTEIERTGGALARLEDGALVSLLGSTHARRTTDIATRRAPITGVSEFVLVSEEPVLRPPGRPAPTDGLLRAHRWAEPFETRRDRSDAAPERPRVYLATLGPPAAHTGRVGFAANLFQAGGLATELGPVAGLAASGCTVACLCSSDELYGEQGTDAVAALRAAGATHVWLAGRDGVDGVDGTLHAGVDALVVLDTVFGQLGVDR